MSSNSSCVVRNCKNKGTRHFPKDEMQKAKWIQAIKHLKPEEWTKKDPRICSAHFKPSDFNITSLREVPDNFRKMLNKTAIPSIFPWTTDHNEDKECSSTSKNQENIPPFDKNNLKRTYARTTLPTKFVQQHPYLNSVANEIEDPLNVSFTNEDEDSVQQMQHTETEEGFVSFVNEEEDSVHQMQHSETEEGLTVETEIYIKEEVLEIFSCSEDDKKEIEKHEEGTQTEGESPINGFSIQNYRKNDLAIHFYTGLENFSKVMLVFNTLGQSAYKLNYFSGKPPQELDALEQFFITLLILRRHKPIAEIAMMYQVTIKQVYNIFITWVRFISLQWQNLDLWIDKESVKAYMPLDFHDKYPSTRVVLDATECPIKKPKLPLAQQVTFSSYKNRNTVKFLVGITPSGLVSYVSPCYGGSASDRQIIERSSILGRFEYNDEVMVDKGLNVQDIFLPYGVKINMPAFFRKGNQIGPETLKSNRKVASKRVHVERVIGALKTYKILTQPLNQTEIILASDIVYICAMLVNFRSSIISKNA